MATFDRWWVRLGLAGVAALPLACAGESVQPECAGCPQMVVIPGGTFRMGDLDGGGEEDERPVHEVRIASFALGKYEVTFDEYDAFCRATGRTLPNDQGMGRGRRPAIFVTWHDAKAYAAWLSERSGLRFRLPSEAEWEYAARAGTETAYSWGDTPSAAHANGGFDWPKDGYEMDSAPAGSFLPNAFGLHDMTGNVQEWVEDCYHDNYEGAPTDGSAWEGEDCPRVFRGGFWYSPAQFLRTASRGSGPPGNKYNSNGGFRVARDL